MLANSVELLWDNAELNFWTTLKFWTTLIQNSNTILNNSEGVEKMARTDILEQKALIVKWIEEKQSKTFIAQQLHCKPETLNRYLQQMGIKYEGNQSGKGVAKPRSSKMTLAEYLQHSKDIQSNKVRLRLLEEGIKEHKCESCGRKTWLGKPIPLELHHKDGNRNNNTITNFQLLCPNCHAFTDSYRGRNCRKE